MRLCRFFKVMGIVIVLALAYIHMQMQIVDLAYKGNSEEQKIKKLVEKNGNTTYKILMLKSARHLGVAMLENDPDMEFADAQDVVQVAASQDIFTEDSLADSSKLAKRTNPLLKLLSIGTEAEAKTAR